MWQGQLARAGGPASAGREAPAEDLKQLKILVGHLKEGQFVTKFRKTFTKAEMNDDLLILPAKWGQAEDKSEYTEILPTSASTPAFSITSGLPDAKAFTSA